MAAIDIMGGGPAGAMAAIAALGEGAQVRVFEKSAFPRHKVCGEFLSPDVLPLLQRAGCADDFLRLRPAVIRRMELHFGSRVVRHRLPRTAHGLSRYALDHLLLEKAASLGAEVVREIGTPRLARRPLVVTTGRTTRGATGDRLFGFKAHFRGLADDAVALFFFEGGYVGISAVEDGVTNVCGLAPERVLRECAFRPERLVARCEAAAARLEKMEQLFEWLNTGPLVLGLARRVTPKALVYPAGDALGFIDPFTGSGLLSAMLTGGSAGRAAVRGQSVRAFIAARRFALVRPFVVSTLCRAALAVGVAGPLASLVPGRWLFRVTRPAV